MAKISKNSLTNKTEASKDTPVAPKEPSIAQAKAKMIQDITPTGVSELADTKEAAKVLAEEEVENIPQNDDKDEEEEYSPEVLSASQPREKKTSNSTGLVVIIILILILLASLAYWYLTKYGDLNIGEFKSAEIEKTSSQVKAAPGVIPLAINGQAEDQADGVKTETDQKIQELDQDFKNLDSDSIDQDEPPVEF